MEIGCGDKEKKKVNRKVLKMGKNGESSVGWS